MFQLKITVGEEVKILFPMLRFCLWIIIVQEKLGIFCSEFQSFNLFIYFFVYFMFFWGVILHLEDPSQSN